MRPYAPYIVLQRQIPRRERFARTGAVLGTVSAALVLGSAIAIAVAPDWHARVTRSVWLGVVATTTPLVALSAWLARREGNFPGYVDLRRLGWLAYTLAMTDGALVLTNAFHHERSPRLLTSAAGVFAALALLPHALDAATAAHTLRSRRFRVVRPVTFQGSSVTVRF